MAKCSSYRINYSDWFCEGGYCQFYPIKHKSSLGFKEFASKKHAKYAYQVQKKLSQYDLAPKLYTSVCKLKFDQDNSGWIPEYSNWGFVTEIAKPIKYTTNIRKLRTIQKLVDDIYQKTKLKFWDCHFSNMGLVNRDGATKLVCIDTGKESFDGNSNAWGLTDPGPKCGYCLKYNCQCCEE